MKIRYILWFGVVTIIFFLLDYMNLPTLLGLETSRMNWDLCMGILNVIIIVALYFFTYKILDEKTIKREQNKKEIADLLLGTCYKECIKYTGYLSRETVEEYIVPKIDFDATVRADSIISNIQNAPFLNENIIMDMARDGQLDKSQIEGYYNVKNAFSQYALMRITLFDAPRKYEPLEKILRQIIDGEEKKLRSNA